MQIWHVIGKVQSIGRVTTNVEQLQGMHVDRKVKSIDCVSTNVEHL